MPVRLSPRSSRKSGNDPEAGAVAIAPLKTIRLEMSHLKMRVGFPTAPALAGIWLVCCSSLVLLGWFLSALGFLNGWGYLAGVATGLVLVAIFARRAAKRPGFRIFRPVPASRFRRLLPALYLTTLALALVGGALYAPSNYDAFSYRLPRMLNWLAEGQWHWIHTSHQAKNTRGTVSEWILMPLLLCGSTGRLLFIPNLVSYALLPGLVFGILSMLGISRRVAWNWMWIFPSGYCFVLQAGSIGNDLIGATLFLAGMFFALRARIRMNFADLALATLGMALATGVKPSNAPLVLPWLVAAWPAIPLLWRNLPRSIALAFPAVMISFAPNAWLNHKHCGDWTGLAAEPVMMKAGAPWLCLSWNVPYLFLQNVTPPVFPFSEAYNRQVQSLIPDELKKKLSDHFQPEAARFHASEMMMEENGPLGLGVLALLVLGALGGCVIARNRNVQPVHTRRHWLPWLVFMATIAALLPMLVRSGLTGSGRYLAPHYLLLIPPFIIAKNLPEFYRGGIWRFAVVICFIAAGSTMILSPARPLWPALTILKAAEAEGSSNPAIQRAWDVYTIYRKRPEAFAPMLDMIPEDAGLIGLLSDNTPEASLWKPFGKRRVLHILPTDSSDSIRERGIEYIVAGERRMEIGPFPTLEEFCREFGAEIIGSDDFAVMARIGIEPWHVLKISAAHDETKTH